MFVFRSLVFICLLAGLAFGQTVSHFAGGSANTAPAKQSLNLNYLKVDAAELLNHLPEFSGKRVMLTAEVISINASQQSLEIYDTDSRKVIDVMLSGLSKGQRRQMLAEPVHHVTIFGRIEEEKGSWLIKAEQIMPVELELAEQ